MLKQILTEGATVHGFEMAGDQAGLSFLTSRHGEAERYLVIKELDELSPIGTIHDEVLSALPQQLKDEPAFDKNCDLVLIYKFENFAEYRELEETILSYEEDPYHFKKYFLYYVEAEEFFLKGKKYENCLEVISDTRAFSEYKTDPFRPSFYSISARVFIKLPFLKVPRTTSELLPLEEEAKQAVAETGLSALYARISAEMVLENNAEVIENLIEKMLNEELENIQSKN